MSNSELISKSKERIIKTALDLCLSQGAHNLTFQGIANILGISQAAMYKHYQNKEDLLAESIAWAAREGQKFFKESTPEKLSAREELKAHIRLNLEFVAIKRNLGVAVIMMHYFASGNAKILKLHEEINQIRITRLQKWLYQIEKQEGLDFEDIFFLSEMIHSLLIGEMIKAFHWPNNPEIQERHKKLWAHIESLLKRCELL